MMRQITRREAEALLDTSQIISSNVKQNHDEMRIVLILTDDRAFLLKYDLQDHKKRYFFDDSRKGKFDSAVIN